jgi:peptidoglycan/xylan/chitin deacetylase (PgdA/CDA1 family)
MLSTPRETRPARRIAGAPVTDGIVLCYHALSQSWDADLSTTPERFERQLRLLHGRGYRGVSFDDAVRAPHERTVAVTFDDAYRSVLELARPILDRLGWPATVFAPTAGVDSGGPLSWPGIDQWLGGPHERELLPMSWRQLRELAAAGWQIGSHTVTHPHLTTLDDDALEHELARSKADCEQHLDAPCTSLAYPYGDVDPRAIDATARAGYATAAALPRRLGASHPLDWPRIGVYFGDDDRRFRLKVSPSVRRLRCSPLWRAFDAPRRALAIR